MGILGKDLFEMKRSAFHTKVYFGNEHYWVEDSPSPIAYGEILTQILNHDLHTYCAALDGFLEAREAKQPDRIIAALDNLYRSFCKLPFYGRFASEESSPIAYASDLFDDEGLDVLASYISGNTNFVEGFVRARDDIQFVQERYAWFLTSLIANQVSEKKKGQRKLPLADQVLKANLEAFVSGVSLGQDAAVDAPAVNIQYTVHETGNGSGEIVEKLYFGRILDFVYVELMRGLQKGFVPKRCANCGRWFLQTPGVSFAYCDSIAPGEKEKTCRDIGALANFQEKVRNNEVWQVHQRAYKKYYARVLKKNMTKPAFEAWARDAEKLRDEALSQYEGADGERRMLIIAELKKKLNEK